MRIFILQILFLILVSAVDRSKFKTCEQSSFCKRHRNKKPGEYAIEPSSVQFNDTSMEATLVSEENRLRLILTALEDSRLRVFIESAGKSLHKRYHPSIALNGEPQHAKISGATFGPETASFSTKTGSHQILIIYKPFRVDVYAKLELIASINSRALLKVEHFREREEGSTYEEGFWEESFSSYADSKPLGSSSVGLDVAFLGFKYLYGLPEHADTFALKSTTNSDPYRLYNLDVFEYEISNGMALYGSIPYVLAHSKQMTLGALWLNAAETWVDVHSSTADKGVLASLIDKIRSSTEVPQIDAHFISESGVIDLYLFLGPKPIDIFRQNSQLTGVYPLPPIFSIAYHQCRWNYNDEADVLGVQDNFDKNDIPLDVIWLDIEYTDGKRYFTWDPVKFPTPNDMIQKLDDKGRKLVVILDPHIKRDDNYFLYQEAKDKGYFVKSADGEKDYDGHCWPGQSAWIDYMNPDARDFWAEQYALKNFNQTYTWNDMNEPSVFSGPEVTMHKDARHFGGFEHRDIHNIYGFLQTLSTYEGHLKRSNGYLRPYILTRSFFVGSQRYASVWTGDNTADWTNLRASVPMLLSLSVAGIPHVGADVGGFFKDVDEQLLVRWYQAGAFQPFFRAHAHIDTKRREPYLYDEKARNALRGAIIKRYQFLPYWYTLFYEHSKSGWPVMRPLWSEFPDDESGFDEEREWMVGNALLVRPVMDPDVSSVSLYLPGAKSIAWYEWDSHRMHVSPGAVYIDTPLEKIPLYQRGGTIIPLRERVRRSSAAMRNDPFTLYVASELDRDFANGTIYLDDGLTFNYANNSEFLYWGITYKKINDALYTISSKCLDKDGVYDPDVYVEKIIIRGVRYYPRNVHLYYDDYNPEDLEFTHDRDRRLMVIRKPGAYISREWRIDIHT